MLYLKDTKHKELELILKFINLGECEVGQIELETFLTAGKDLKVNGPNKDTVESVIVPEELNTTEHDTSESLKHPFPIDNYCTASRSD